MSIYAAFDGGGSKLQSILFDDSLNILAMSESAGVNPNYYSREAREKNLSDAVDGLFKNFDADAPRIVIDKIYGVFCANPDEIISLLSRRADVGGAVPLGEGQLGLLASGVWPTGFAALSGTGSDIFGIRDGVNTGTVGGYGYLLSDEGSGYWIGRESIHAAIHSFEGRGEQTMLVDMIAKALKHDDFRAALFSIYKLPKAPAAVASLARVCGQAASLGDAAALGIIRAAGRVLADQTAACAKLCGVSGESDVCVIGGTWKSHPDMFATFESELHKVLPDFRVHMPSLEPVAACMLYPGAEESGFVSDEAFRRAKASAERVGLSYNSRKG